jgi:hypothetical protein
MSLRNPVTPTKKSLKKEILEEITEKFTGKVLDTVNQNVQNALKKFQDTPKKKNMRRNKNK